MDIKRFYLENYDFQVFVNKNLQSYRKTLDDELQNPITVEYYKSMQKGGCNEKQENGGKNSVCTSTTDTTSSCGT